MASTIDDKPARLLSLDFFQRGDSGGDDTGEQPGELGAYLCAIALACLNGMAARLPTWFSLSSCLSLRFLLLTQWAAGSWILPRTTRTIVKALKRALILFGPGFYSCPCFPKVFTEPAEAFQHVRIPGVLQRIAVVFFISSVIFLKTSEKEHFPVVYRVACGLLGFDDALCSCCIGYPNLEKGNQSGRMDRPEYYLAKPICKEIRQTWDPEGIFGTIPAVATGVCSESWSVYLKAQRAIDAATKMAWLFSAGFAAIAMGWAWGLQFPINKSLWTSSFVLFTGGLATVVLSLSYWIIDVNQL